MQALYRKSLTAPVQMAGSYFLSEVQRIAKASLANVYKKEEETGYKAHHKERQAASTTHKYYT